ncbi:MAG: hypothetical protein ACHQNT_08955 [Bacteroidia bacterium]
MYTLCRLLGHRWVYKNLENAVDKEGNPYPFKAVHKCTRCNTYEYKYDSWIDQNKLPLQHKKLLLQN